MTNFLDWQRESKCRTQTPEQAERLFYPGSGGSPNRAKEFCEEGIPCPVQGKCLQYAVDSGAEGFLCGTTETERAQMAIQNNALKQQLKAAMPPEPDRKKRKVFRKLVETPDPHAWLEDETFLREVIGL